MQAMIELPNYSVAQFQMKRFENGIKIDVERVDFAFVDIVANLPADVATRREYSFYLTEY